MGIYNVCRLSFIQSYTCFTIYHQCKLFKDTTLGLHVFLTLDGYKFTKNANIIRRYSYLNV